MESTKFSPNPQVCSQIGGDPEVLNCTIYDYTVLHTELMIFGIFGITPKQAKLEPGSRIMRDLLDFVFTIYQYAILRNILLALRVCEITLEYVKI